MAATDRTVRRLHLRAPSEAHARRLVTTLEDALRCASLGDEGARLVVVKRLALGRVADGISSQALSRLIEQRIAQAALHWVDADADEAPAAPCVAFAGRLQARAALAARLLQGRSAAAWYWPRAVPEYQPGADAGANLRRIAWTIAGWPEARAALPAWVAELVRVDLGARLALAIGEAEGGALVQRAGLAPPAARAAPDPHQEPQAFATGAAFTASASPGVKAGPLLPPWIARTLGALPAAAPSTPSGPGARAAPRAGSRALSAGPPDQGGTGDAVVSGPQGRVTAVPASPPAPESGKSAHGELPSAQPPDPELATRAPRQPSSPARATPAAPATAPAWLPPTSCGGLLFLLPVLARCGLPDWCGDAHAVAFTAGVLHRALRRAHAPADDPLWALASPLAPDLPPLPAPAPASWRQLLAPPESDRLSFALAHAASADAQAAAWLVVARRWLQRAARLGLVRLVRRPARVACTPTHVDLHFALDQSDLRLRRLGLDLDPGWLPWFGRVVGFHFGVLP